MSVNTQRYRSGPVSEVQLLVKAGETNKIGDLVGQTLSGGKSYAQTFATLAAGTGGFQDSFLGVQQAGATGGSESVDTPCLVYTDGEFEFDLTVASLDAYGVGQAIGATGNQTVYPTTVIGETIGNLARQILVGDTTCLVRIKSNVMGGGVQSSP